MARLRFQGQQGRRGLGTSPDLTRRDPLLLSPVPAATGRTWRPLLASPSGGLTLTGAPDPGAAGAMNRLSPSSLFSHSGLGKKLHPPEWPEGGALARWSLRGAPGLLFRDTAPFFPKSPCPAPPPQRHFSNRAISEKGERAERLAVWPISASATPLQPGIGRVLVAKETLTSG